MRSRTRHQHGRSHPSLRLPSKREVSYFRESRLLRHLHEQLIEQIDENPNDWQLHFQLANLFAFTDDSFCKNKDIDIIHAEIHYQKALKLLKTLHEQDYIAYQNANNILFESVNTPNLSPFDIDINAIDDEETSAQPKIQTITAQLLYDNEDSLSYSSNKKRSNKSNKSFKSDTDYLYKKRRKKNRKKHNGFEITPPTQSNNNKIIKRKLLIAIHNNDDTIAKEIECNYASPLSEEEIATKREKNKKYKKKNGLRVDVTAKYLSAVATLNAPFTSKKRPSIVMMFNPDSPQNNGGKSIGFSEAISGLHLNGTYSNNSPISLLQSESETATNDISDDYTIPLEINKGYTECFFGYGKYLCQNKRKKEGIHNLLECASWYNDSFVDPSCLTSLILPPQFLFQDSVKKRHCINFRTLTKYISKSLIDQQKYLDKKFKKINMNKYINEYNQYLDEFQKEINKNITIVVNNYTPISNDTSSNISNTSPISNISNTSDLRLQTSLHSNQSIQSDISYQTLLSPDILLPDISYDKNKMQLINYKIYPQHIQDLVNEYTDLCSYYHRLGLLLSDFLRYSDAKREYSKALKIFKKLKIKPALYDDILTEIRMTQRNSIQSASCQERAQILAQKHKNNNNISRNNIRPLSPSFEFSFSDHSSFLITAK